jgi:hypothetical protein
VDSPAQVHAGAQAQPPVGSRAVPPNRHLGAVLAPSWPIREKCDDNMGSENKRLELELGLGCVRFRASASSSRGAWSCVVRNENRMNSHAHAIGEQRARMAGRLRQSCRAAERRRGAEEEHEQERWQNAVVLLTTTTSLQTLLDQFLISGSLFLWFISSCHSCSLSSTLSLSSAFSSSFLYICSTLYL